MIPISQCRHLENRIRVEHPRFALDQFGKRRIYRLYDEVGELLYVGQTFNIDYRLAAHRYYKDWWPEVAFLELMLVGNPKACDDEERRAIIQENPRYNAVRYKVSA